MSAESRTAPAPLGLTGSEAADRLRLEGPNTVAAPAQRGLAGRVLRQLADPLIALLLAAAVRDRAAARLPDTAVILLVVVVNTAIGVVQEVRADRAIAALDQLAAPTARVVRDGAERVMPAADLVRGDLVSLDAGDIVPGRSAAWSTRSRLPARRVRPDRRIGAGRTRYAGDEMPAGTVVTTGRASGTVVRTGAAQRPRPDRRPRARPPGRRRPRCRRRLAGLGRMLGLHRRRRSPRWCSCSGWPPGGRVVADGDHRGQPGRRRRTRVAAGRRHARAGAGRPPDGGAHGRSRGACTRSRPSAR